MVVKKREYDEKHDYISLVFNVVLALVSVFKQLLFQSQL